jgi:endonuclease YncB( thermonuclease family)
MKTSKSTTKATSYIAFFILLLTALGCSEASQQSQTTPLPFYDNTKPTPARTAELSNSEKTITGKVVGVSDGDTITVFRRKQETI